jgi:hypothetical protein
VSGTLTALLLQRSGAGVAHGTWRMADLAEHLVKVAGRWQDASLGDKPLDARWQRGGLRSIATHKRRVSPTLVINNMRIGAPACRRFALLAV